MPCVPTSPMFAYYSRAFGKEGQLYSQKICETAITEATVVFFVNFKRAVEFMVSNLSLPSR